MPHPPPDATIVAIATATGPGGVGIVRLSGPMAWDVGQAVCGRQLRVRRASFVRFREVDGTTIDDGIVLAFRGPASFTGEDVVELQAHGSPVVLDQLVQCCIRLGARQALPGEFSQRAFLNGKLDLVQAEAIADLIAAADVRAA
ncbi:MAG: tRNA uridine-5-carboxymethylaminomethyl(34) synthesis GTPase MnmE, partial [Thermomonas sp.]|nr:tRNA uridine-5-carboxymethylaminomethyl(34) synthesis GTPase MnmE [Thermomonas sp.]